MKKIDTALKVIRERLQHGEPELSGVPSERRLAEELGVSRKTIRLAYKRLLDAGQLVRGADGKILPAKHQESRPPQATIALVAHHDSLPETGRWHVGIRIAIPDHRAVLRIVLYSHYGDGAVLEALNRYDGVFFLPAPEEIPEWLKMRMREAPARVVVVGQNAVAHGIPSVDLFPASAIVSMFDHLRGLGHQRIDCLNAQGPGPVIDERIAVWQRELAKHQLDGELHSCAERRPRQTARRIVRSLLQNGPPSAIYCTTAPAALGAMRGAYDEGVVVGRDISICAVNDEDIAEVLAPALTSVRATTRSETLAGSVDWMITGEDWQGPLLIEPQGASLFIGESTCSPTHQGCS